MPSTNPLGTTRASEMAATGPTLVLAGALAIVLACAAVFQETLSPEALLPASCLLFFTLAAAIALIAWRQPLSSRGFSYWDAAGVLTLIGLCIAAAVEPEQMVGIVAGADHHP